MIHDKHRKADSRFIPTRFIRHSILEDGFAYYLAVESFAIILSIHQYRHVKLSFYDFPLVGQGFLQYLDGVHVLTWIALFQMFFSVILFVVTAFMRKSVYSSLISGISGFFLCVNWLLHTALLSTDVFLLPNHSRNEFVEPFIHHINSSMVVDGLITSAFCLIFAIIQFNNFRLVYKVSKIHNRGDS